MAEMVIVVFLLASAISIDAMSCGFAYGASRTRVKILHMLTISGFGSVFLGISLFAGYAISQVISEDITVVVGFTALIVIGFYKIFQSLVQSDEATVSKEAEALPRKVMKWREAILLAFILSIDSLAVGVGASIQGITIYFGLFAIGITFVMGFLLFGIGYLIGGMLVKNKTTLNLSWVAGVVLITMAFINLFL